MFSSIPRTFSLFILILILLLAVALPEIPSLAQTSPQEEKIALEKELKLLEEKIAQYDKDINKTEQGKKTLQNQIYTLRKKVEKLNLQIQQSNVIIKDISLQIKDTEGSIEKTSLKIENSKEKLSNILRLTYEENQKSLAEVLLAEPKLSDFFDNLMALETLNAKNQELLNNIKNLKTDLSNQRESLDGEKDGLEKTVKIQILQKQESEATKKDQEYFLKLTEKQYQQQLKEKKDVEKQAAEIRAKLFRLIGVAKAPTFGEALAVAKNVAGIVNIRPALLLAVISQESAIGRNVGQCALTDPVTGSGKRISTGSPVSKLMKPTRDVQPFLKITAALGKDPYNTPVSCPLSVGYGGAMGPAQFIPSTWNLYYDKLQSVLGRSGDPWAIVDSFTAAGLYLSDLGASAKTSDREASAASRYYGGSSGYARGVMMRAACIQNFIDLGTMSSGCESLIF